MNAGNYYAEKARARGIPAYMIPGLVRWIEKHVEPGSFLRALLRNDLKGACECADDTNQHLLREYVMFLYNDAPSGCWGSVTKYEAWAAAAHDPDAPEVQS